MLSIAFFNSSHRAERVACLFWFLMVGGNCFRSGKEFDITATRIAASNPLLKEVFVEALGHPQ